MRFSWKVWISGSTPRTICLRISTRNAVASGRSVSTFFFARMTSWYLMSSGPRRTPRRRCWPEYEKSSQGNGNATNGKTPELILLQHDRGAEGVVPERRRFRVLRRPDRQVAEGARNIFLLVPAMGFPQA